MAVEIVASPGSTRRVDAVKYEAMRAVMLRVLPRNALGLTARELRDKMLPQLSQDL